jgi:hypothetical protein
MKPTFTSPEEQQAYAEYAEYITDLGGEPMSLESWRDGLLEEAQDEWPVE